MCFTVKSEFGYFKIFDNRRAVVRWESRWSFLWTTYILNKWLCKHEENRRRRVSLCTHRHGVWRCPVTQYFSVLKVFKVLNYSDLFFPSPAHEFNSLLSCWPLCQQMTWSVSDRRRPSTAFLCLSSCDVDGLERLDWGEVSPLFFDQGFRLPAVLPSLLQDI